MIRCDCEKFLVLAQQLIKIIPLLYLLIYKVAIRRQSQLPLQWYHVRPQVEAFISLELRPLDQQILKFQRQEAKILVVDH